MALGVDPQTPIVFAAGPQFAPEAGQFPAEGASDDTANIRATPKANPDRSGTPSAMFGTPVLKRICATWPRVCCALLLDGAV